MGAEDFDSLGTLSLEMLCHRPTELMWRKESLAWILEVKGWAGVGQARSSDLRTRSNWNQTALFKVLNQLLGMICYHLI